MKPINTLLLSLTILLFASCSLSSNSNQVDCERDDVLGTWEITMASFKKMRKEKPANEIITSFQLNADSSVVVYLGENHENKTDGTWKWKVEKQLGNDNFGISMSTDVFLYTPSEGLGLQLNKNNRKICLSVADYAFTKQQKARR